ncbi:DUF4491 family protein [Treponema sp. TIM-1]|uniref:DUF4491 family protein n=1 Tax=Treponema sp. TIM-1 TaxID=2898417 RepID=UPI0039811A94
MYLHGLFAGATALIIIGLFHPVVIKGEYHFGKGIWPFFLISGLGLIAAACIIAQVYLSVFLGITGFTCIWTIKELFEQEKRVERGWFPRKSSRQEPRLPARKAA